MKFTVAILSAILAVVAMWAFLAIIGISEGSHDLCTESFKSAVAWIARK